MIHIVTHANRDLYADELLQAHRQRREAFVEQRGWPLSVREDGGEYDEGDDERAIYFLAIDKAGQVEASMRARPTDDFCVVADVFPHFLADGPASAKAPHPEPGIRKGTKGMPQAVTAAKTVSR